MSSSAWAAHRGRAAPAAGPSRHVFHVRARAGGLRYCINRPRSIVEREREDWGEVSPLRRLALLLARDSRPLSPSRHSANPTHRSRFGRCRHQASSSSPISVDRLGRARRRRLGRGHTAALYASPRPPRRCGPYDPVRRQWRVSCDGAELRRVVTYAEIPPVMRADAMIAVEDGAVRSHTAGRPDQHLVLGRRLCLPAVRCAGVSTITQQLASNIFLKTTAPSPQAARGHIGAGARMALLPRTRSSNSI